MKTILPVGDFTWTDGRCYQKNTYSVPYEIRQFLKPLDPAEGDFFYFDASNAELLTLAYHYNDTQLIADIQSGDFWSLWVEEGFPKADVKKNIFCMQYSASTVTFVPNTPADFFEKFTTRYPIWWNGIKRAAWLFEHCHEELRGRYRDLTTGKEIPLPAVTEYHGLFKFLNYRLQRSLSSALQIIFAEFFKWNQTHGGKNYQMNFDSCLFTNPLFTKEKLVKVLENIAEEAYAENQVPALYKFKWSTGSNFAEAQGWTE